MCLQARAEVDAAKQQLVLLQAEADGARIRGNAETQAAQVSWLAENFQMAQTLGCVFASLDQDSTV